MGTSEQRRAWGYMYLGACAALGVTNTGVSYELAGLTESDDEAIAAIEAMRRARPGDRVWPALAYLRELRAKGYAVKR